MRITNMTSSNGNVVPNQVIITDGDRTVFQSYRSTIAIEQRGCVTKLDPNWEFSKTTMRYACQFLGERNKKAIQAGIKSGQYIVENLNS